MPPPEGPDQQQIPNVRTGDQQYKAHYSKRDGKRWKKRAGIVERSLPQREQPDTAATIRRGIVVFQSFGDSGNLRLRLLWRHARLQTHVALNPSFAAIFEFVIAGV